MSAAKTKNNECGIKTYYQAIIHPMFNKTIAYEAHVRLIDNDVGSVSYKTFLPIVEKSEINALLEKWIFEKTCKTLQKMITGQIELDYISINVSARYLKKENYISDLLEIIKRTGVLAEKICLEIPESALDADADAIIDKMHELKREGFKIAVDDYGANYMPLSRLDSVPAEIIKLDRAITDRIIIDPKTEKNAEEIIRRAKELSLKVIAKAVEDEMQKCMLMILGCDYMQGSLFGKEVRENEILSSMPYKKIAVGG